jgi:hypothetical protein
MEKSLELIELSNINKVSLFSVSSCSNTGSIRGDPYWNSRKNNLKLIELSSIIARVRPSGEPIETPSVWQTDGVSMGSPLGPTLANIIMTEFEELIFIQYK